MNIMIIIMKYKMMNISINYKIYFKSLKNKKNKKNKIIFQHHNLNKEYTLKLLTI
jgi:hypothetical protein